MGMISGIACSMEEERKQKAGNHVLKEIEKKWICTDGEETVVKLQKQ